MPPPLPLCLLAALAALAALAGATHRPTNWTPPDAAQVVDWKRTNVLEPIAAQREMGGFDLFIPPGSTAASLAARPFHIYDPEFFAVIGDTPSLTLIAETDGDPLFHEAAVWYPPTDTMFFVQNAGARAAGTGLNKSAIVQRIAVAEAAAYASEKNATGKIHVMPVNATPAVVNPNGGTNWRGKVVFAGEGMGETVPSALYVMEPRSPWNTSVLLNNFFGRQFSSLNDVAVHPNGWIYFTDVDYGALQDFRGKVNIRRQVYRFDPDSGVVQAVTDAAVRPNGITFSPDGKWLYIADTGAAEGFYGEDFGKPASIYRYPVTRDGRVGPPTLFAYVSPGVPDGIHCDTQGRVYAGAGDGVHVWNRRGTFLGKIYTGSTVANFQFAGKGRMVLLAETRMFFATLAAEGAALPGMLE